MKKFGNIALFVLLVLVSAVTTFWLVNRNNTPYGSAEDALRAERLAAIPGETAEEKFSYILGRVTTDISEKTKEYRKQRAVMPQLAAEANMQTPDYISQNFELTKASALKLRAGINGVMKVFDTAQDDIDMLVAGQDEVVRQKILDEWKKLQEERTVLYIEFFSLEEDILEAYVALLKFYNDKSGVATFSEEEQRLVFTDPSDQTTVDALRSRIQSLSEEQKSILQQG